VIAKKFKTKRNFIKMKKDIYNIIFISFVYKQIFCLLYI